MDDTDIRFIWRTERSEDSLWHYMVAHNAREISPHVYDSKGSVDTICGIKLVDGPVTIDLSHEQHLIPERPNCEKCLRFGLEPALFEALEEILSKDPELVPATSRAGTTWE